MRLHTYTLDELRQAVADGESLYALDTGEDGFDDVLYGRDAKEVIREICHEHDTNAMPDHWTLRLVSLKEVEARFK